jgi:hypothetical protein
MYDHTTIGDIRNYFFQRKLVNTDYNERKYMTMLGILNALAYKYDQEYLINGLPGRNQIRAAKPIQFHVTGLKTYLTEFWNTNHSNTRLKWLRNHISQYDGWKFTVNEADLPEIAKLTDKFDESEIAELIDLAYEKALTQGTTSPIQLENWLDALSKGDFKRKQKNTVLVSRTSIYECLRILEGFGAIRCHWRKFDEAKDRTAMVISVKICHLLICAEQIEEALVDWYDYELDGGHYNGTPNVTSVGGKSYPMVFLCEEPKFPFHRGLLMVNLFMWILDCPWRREKPSSRLEIMNKYWKFPLPRPRPTRKITA